MLQKDQSNGAKRKAREHHQQKRLKTHVVGKGASAKVCDNGNQGLWNELSEGLRSGSARLSEDRHNMKGDRGAEECVNGEPQGV